MRRREFITILGGTVAAWPLTARGQQSTRPVIGFLRSASLTDTTHLVTAFRQGLKEVGFVEGQNVTVEYQAAEGRPDRLQALTAELVRRPVSVIVANGPAALASKAATSTVPIVFASGDDPVKLGLVASLNRPGGNVTGAVFITGALGAKRLELLHQLVPKATKIGVLLSLSDPESDGERKDVETAAKAIGQQLIILDVSSEREIEAAFATLVSRGAGALQVSSGVFMFANRKQIVALAARHALPASYPLRDFVTAGGLMSYGTSITDAYREVGIYAGRILKGENPGELPVIRSSKFEFIIDRKTAKTLGLEIPPTLLALADEVIE